MTTEDRLSEIAEKLGDVQGQLKHMATKEAVATLATRDDLDKLRRELPNLKALKKAARKHSALSGGVVSAIVSGIVTAFRGG